MAKYLSGRVPRTAQTALTTDRYGTNAFLGLNQAEPNLGDPTLAYPSPPTGQQYQIVSIVGYPGERYWVPISGGLIPGSISVFEEGSLVGSLSSITQLNFVGNSVTAQAVPLGIAATITVAPPGNNGSVLFKESGDFATSSGLLFNGSVGILTVGNGLVVGTGGTFFNVNTNGFVGIGTTNPTQELEINGDIRLTGTIYDYNNQPGTSTQILVKNNFGGVTWVNQGTVRAGAGGTYQNIQFHNNAGLVDGSPNFVFDEINSRVGIGSTQPKVLLDVLGISSFKGETFIDNLTITGVTTVATLGVAGTTTTRNLLVTDISTVGFLTGTSAFFTGIVTATKFIGAIDVTNLYVTGSSTFLQKVNVNSDLGVTGLTTTQNLEVYQSTTLNHLKVSGISTFDSQINTNNLSVTGVGTFDNIKLDTNTVSTLSGNLILDSSAGTTQVNDVIYVTDTTQSTSKDTGSIVTEGGVGIEKDLYVGGTIFGNVNGNIIGYASSISVSTDTTDTIRYIPFVDITSGLTTSRTDTAFVWNPSSNSLGIGTINPTQSLHVQGSSRVTGARYDSSNSPGTSGQVLQSTATGTQWVTQGTLNVSYADNAGIATNLKGGIASQIPYQTAPNTTAFIPNGTVGQLLQSNGTSAPSWTSSASLNVSYADNAGIATNLKGGTAYQIPYQSAVNTTLFIPNGTVTGQLLQYNSGSAPSWVNPTGLTVDKASYADNAGIATNLKGGIAAQIPYQTAPNTTDFIPNGSSGQLLQSNGTSAPSWVNPTGLTVDKASYADNAGITTNLKGGATGSIPYQTSANTTTFLADPNVNGRILTWNDTTNAPIWSDPISISVGTASSLNVTTDDANANRFLVLSSVTSGVTTALVDSNITYNPSTDLLTTPNIKPTSIQDSGGGTGTNNFVLTANGSGGWTWKSVTGSGGAGAIGGITIQEEGTTVGTQLGITTVNFIGATVTATNPTTGTANITVSAASNITVTQTGYGCANPITVTGGSDIGIGSTSNAYGTRYVQSTAPSSPCDGDIWYDTSSSSPTVSDVPTGSVFYFAASTAPTGYLECNGAAISRSTYSALFSGIGTVFGAGNGSTTFNIPDLRGEFIRGWDNARGVDTNTTYTAGGTNGNPSVVATSTTRTLGSSQSWAIENIIGTLKQLNYTATGTGVFTAGYNSGGPEQTSFNNAYGVDFNTARVVNSSNETRPRNIALLPCIKY